MSVKLIVFFGGCMERKGKVIILFIFIIVAIFIFTNEDSSDDEDLRFRVIANSDSEEDQNIKYIVKDRIINEIDLSNLDLNIIEDKCSYILKGLNVSYDVNVVIENQTFESKYCDDELIKGGTYKTLVIKLGNAKGKNYWTILCPEYFNIGYEDVNSGDVQYKIWIWEEIKKILCK